MNSFIVTSVPAPTQTTKQDVAKRLKAIFFEGELSSDSEAVNLSPDRARRPRCERGEEKARSHSSAYGKGFRQSPARHIGRRGDGRG